MDQLIGHSVAKELLLRMVKSGRLGSGLILVGAEGVGKRKMADWLVEGGWKEERGESKEEMRADLMVIERQRNDKGDLKKNISIEQIRDLIQRLSMSSFSGGAKIGLIDGAETLSLDAANALLKTLEDPSGKTHVILLATSVANLPATILSRCQVIHLGLVPRSEITTALVDRGAPRSLAEEIAGFAAGRPGIALTLLKDAEALESAVASKDRLRELLAASLSRRFGIIQESVKGEDKRKEEISQMLNVWETTLHDLGEITLLARLTEARRAIAQNVSPQLALEHAFL